MNTKPLTAANHPEPNQPTKKSFWRMEAQRWCWWFIVWLILTAIPLCAGIDYAEKRNSSNAAYAALATLLAGNYVMSLAALVKAFVKEK